MRKLLNTVYVTDEQTYLTLDNNNVIFKKGDEVLLKIPFDNIENIVCFSYLGCSPALMGACVEKQIPINFISPQGKYLAKVCGETKGNVFLRIAQIDLFREEGLTLAKGEMAAKISNCIQTIKRSKHDIPLLREDQDILQVETTLRAGIEKIKVAENIETVLGIEGNCASAYFDIFGKLITNQNNDLQFSLREKRPPLDPVNAMLSFCYTLATSDCAAALETVGLDSYIGFYHSLRSGRMSLACDLVEEIRCIVERFVLTMINLRIVDENDFDTQISGAVWLNAGGRKKILTKWQEKKRSELIHPEIKEKLPYGLIPYVQSNLLAKYIRGELECYVPFLLKG